MLSPTEELPGSACFCNPWGSSKPLISKDVHQEGGGYTDADLAADMNVLSFAERQAMVEDIHGVLDVIEETTELVAQSIEEMKQVLGRMNSQQREAWDRAVFLRPALADDQRFHLIFLRARRFQAYEATVLMVSYMRVKRDLWGDDLLIHRITWDDLPEEGKAIFRNGAYRILKSRDRSGRGIIVAQLSQHAVADNYRIAGQTTWYMNSVVEDDPITQQRGLVIVADFGGEWKSSSFELIRYSTVYPFHTQPFRTVSTHCISDDPTRYHLIQAIRKFFPQDTRRRFRLHFGSPLETEYELRTFGLDVSHELFLEEDKRLIHHKKDLEARIEEDIRRRQQLDDEWRRQQAPYRDPASPIALFPNQHDVIMGRKKVVAATWPGNIMYRQVLLEYVDRYIEAQDVSSDRINKTMISVEILHILKSHYKSRLLNREDTRWVVLDDTDAQTKISRTLRDLAREKTTIQKL